MQIVGGAAMLLLIRRECKGGAIILTGKYAEKHSVSLNITYLLFLTIIPLIAIIDQCNIAYSL